LAGIPTKNSVWTRAGAWPTRVQTIMGGGFPITPAPVVLRLILVRS
jgi:hypothetical protein